MIGPIAETVCSWLPPAICVLGCFFATMAFRYNRRRGFAVLAAYFVVAGLCFVPGAVGMTARSWAAPYRPEPEHAERFAQYRKEWGAVEMRFADVNRKYSDVSSLVLEAGTGRLTRMGAASRFVAETRGMQCAHLLLVVAAGLLWTDERRRAGGQNKTDD